jgi:TPR repeat protein
LGSSSNSDESEDLFNRASELEDGGQIKAAIALYARAVLLENVAAMNNLATIYDDTVQPPRPELAVSLYRRAVALGCDLAAWNLAMHYRVLDDEETYRHWLQVAADMGHEHAARVLTGAADWSDD